MLEEHGLHIDLAVIIWRDRPGAYLGGVAVKAYSSWILDLLARSLDVGSEWYVQGKCGVDEQKQLTHDYHNRYSQ